MDILKRKRKELTNDLIPKGVSKTIPRPAKGDIGLLDSVDNMKKSYHLPKIDPFFIQEISDRLYGPDSDDYIQALKSINERFRPRSGRTGVDFYDPDIVIETKKREREINQRII